MTKRWPWVGLSIWVVGLLLGGCATVASPPARSSLAESAGASERATPDLSGVWEYEENNFATTLRLDAHGNGTYEWQGGRFETRSVVDGMWRGIWIQPRNDREGEFALELSDDGQAATGYWWYTRIGKDQDPNEAGGTFTLQRLSHDLDDEEPMDGDNEYGEEEAYSPDFFE